MLRNRVKWSTALHLEIEGLEKANKIEKGNDVIKQHYEKSAVKFQLPYIKLLTLQSRENSKLFRRIEFLYYIR